MSRPTEFNQGIADAICDQISGGESLRTICEAAVMPSQSMVFRWLAKNDGFREQYARAREAQMNALAEQILQIADTPVEGERTEESKDGFKTVREDMLGHRRLQIDSRKWLMAKLAPKKYGERVTNEHVGKDGGPIEHSHTADLEAARRIAAALTKVSRET